MEKEQVIEKLEEAFEVACKRFVKTGGNVTPEYLSEVNKLGDLLISAKSNTRQYVDIRIETAIERLVSDLKEKLKGVVGNDC